MKIKINLLLSALVLFSNTNLIAKKMTFTGTQSWGKQQQDFLKTWQPKFIDLKQIDYSKITPPPEDSGVLKREMEYLKALQDNRTVDDLAAIVHEKHLCGFYLNGYRMGFNPAIDQFLLDVYFDARFWGFYLKDKFNRVRPSFISNGQLTPSIDNPPHPAFPSNHTFQAVVLALVLGDLQPKMKSKLLADAIRIGRNREIAGVHYPSDTETSIVIANDFVKKLRSKEAYKAKVKSLKSVDLVSRTGVINEQDYVTCKKATNGYAEKNRIWKKTAH